MEIEQYSDDGEYLASDLGLIDLNAQTPVLSALTTGEPLAGYPDWDANSNAILFQAHNADPFSLTGDPVQLFTIRRDGTGLRQLTERTAGEPFIALPAWADHGESILATLIHSTEMFTLARMAADGSGIHELLGEGGQPIIGAHARAASR